MALLLLADRLIFLWFSSHSTENQAMPAILKISGNRCLASIEIAITFMFNPA